MSYSYLRIILLTTLFISTSLSAENDVNTCPFEEDDNEEISVEELSDNNDNVAFFSFFDETHKSISSGVESLVQNIDDFFTESSHAYESSGSYLRLRQNVIFREAGVVDSSTDIRFKLRLPNTEKRLKLFFETRTEDDPNNILTGSENAPTTNVKEDDFRLAVQTESDEKYGFKFKPRLGIHLGSEIDPYVKFRLNKDKEYVKWNLKWHETLQWYDSIGWGLDSYFELGRKISDNDLFRSSTFARWQNVTDKFDLSHVFSMSHVFSKRRALSYYVGAYGVSEPTVHATHYLLGATYRQNIHKDYLFFEIEPQIRYEKTNDFHADHSLALRLEVLFKR